ncbi:glycosyltransferase [Pseudoduganella danionis]|uniref:Glycosyltransferase n=2 Tax=Pseudoduganella danionis TaxID=1890295 RepID=A0ABW9SWN9_9BURK|nr:glycosyltransferase [Pseudoduganella danionis]
MATPGFILSICIPTFNRGPFLKQTLESIVAQPAFHATHDIEVCISDNCSDDSTAAVGQAFAAAYPDKIQYQRHPEPIFPDKNFEAALRMGSGAYLKLHNDNLVILDGSLAELVKVYSAVQTEKPVVFFTNGNMYAGQPLEILPNLDAFVARVSYFATWIGGFGMWREEFYAMPDFSRNAHLKLVQTDVMLRLMGIGKRAIVLYGNYFAGVNAGRKSGYNVAQVFGQNYLSLLKPYLASGQLSNEVFQAEKKSLLINHIIPYYFGKDNDFSKTGFFEYMQDYLHDDYFYQAVEHLIGTAPAAAAAAPAPAPAPAPVEKSFEEQKADYWRALNPHNHTVLTMSAGPFDFSKISVGRRTYGELNIMAYGRDAERLTIGSFVSIASEVKFMLGGNHPYAGFSTFPFLVKYFGETLESSTKGPIVVGDDVWIGYDVLIMSGVTIGQGAIIAAGSVITKDVAPYTIVGGNPARYIKHRYAPAIVEKMLAFDFNKVSDARLLANRELLYQGLTEENVDAILAALQD